MVNGWSKCFPVDPIAITGVFHSSRGNFWFQTGFNQVICVSTTFHSICSRTFITIKGDTCPIVAGFSHFPENPCKKYWLRLKLKHCHGAFLLFEAVSSMLPDEPFSGIIKWPKLFELLRIKLCIFSESYVFDRANFFCSLHTATLSLCFPHAKVLNYQLRDTLPLYLYGRLTSIYSS